MGTSTIRLLSIKSSLPSLYPLRHSRDKIFQVLYCFSVLQATKSWVGPGNEATFLANFALSDSTAPIPLIVKLLFSRKLHSAFHLDRKTRSQRSHVFRLTGTAALHCQWPIIELAKNVSPKNKMAASHDVKKFKVSFRPVMGYARAGGKGTAGTAMAVPVFEGEKMASLRF